MILPKRLFIITVALYINSCFQLFATAEEQPDLIRSLLRSDVYDHPVSEIRLIETHISWVILTGSYAYKIKKPVNLGFLDFSTLDKRRFCCSEELRLNSRLAESVEADKNA